MKDKVLTILRSRDLNALKSALAEVSELNLSGFKLTGKEAELFRIINRKLPSNRNPQAYRQNRKMIAQWNQISK